MFAVVVNFVISIAITYYFSFYRNNFVVAETIVVAASISVAVVMALL